MLKSKLDEIEARALAATPKEKWAIVVRGNTIESYGIPGVCGAISPKTKNAEFLVHSRDDVLELVKEVRQLEDEIRRAQESFAYVERRKS